MKQKIYKVEFTVGTFEHEFPEGWKLNKFLDVNENYFVALLDKVYTPEEERQMYQQHQDRYGAVTATTAVNGYTGVTNTLGGIDWRLR